MPENNFSSGKLIAELERLEKLLPQTDTGPLTAVIRLIRTDAPLESLLSQKNLTQWLILPLNSDKFPALEQLRQRLQLLAFEKDHDPLSGLRNRRAFDRFLALEVDRSTRFKTPLSLCVLDLDRFKKINDKYGHLCGDLVIQAVGAILQRETRKIDMAARIGGEEFGLILPGTGLISAQKLVQRILESIREARVDCAEVRGLSFTCSAGLAACRGKQAPDAEKLLAEADKALYRAKAGGRDRLESAPLLDAVPPREQTLVLQNEKRFLFSSFRGNKLDEEKNS
jgi:diguanylate cyclase (GGDEF)-like protein